MTQPPTTQPPRPSSPPAPPASGATAASKAPGAAPTQVSYPAAGLDRRFYAFALDRLVVWSLYGGAVYLAIGQFFSDGATGAGIGVLVGVVVGLGLVNAVLLGVAGLSLGKAVTGLRLVREGAGTPIGVPAALLRTVILAVASLPTFMLGVATLAWTAVVDRGGWRRGWHDHVTGSVVVDIRPIPVAEEIEEDRPRQIVNLTAMRLMPNPAPSQVAPTPRRAPRETPDPARRPATPPPASPPATSTPATTPAPRPRQAPTPTPAPAPPAPRRPSGPPPGATPAGGAPAGRHSAPPSAPPSAPTSAPPSAPPTARPAGPGPTARWRVTFDTGETFEVEGLALVGRRPEARAGEQVAHLVSLRSADMSLSKTHAQFQVVPDGALVVMDRGSTNGSVLVRQGVAKALSAGRPATLLAGDKVRFGDREMSVERP